MTYLGIALSFDDVGRILENFLTAANYVLLPGFIGREEQSITPLDGGTSKRASLQGEELLVFDVPSVTTLDFFALGL